MADEVHPTLDSNGTFFVSAAATEAKTQPRSASFDAHSVSASDMGRFMGTC